MTKIAKYLSTENKIIHLGVGLAVVYWFLETVMDAFVFRQGHFIERIYPSDANEVWMRLLVMCLLLAFSAYAHLIVSRLMRTQQTSRASNQQA